MKKKNKISQAEALKLGTDHQFIPSLKLGPWSSYSLLHDPKHLGFVLARYKFCAKMLEGKKNVLEVGCGDGMGIPIVAQHAGRVVGIDPVDRLVRGNRQRLKKIKNVFFKSMDICKQVPAEVFDGMYSIDVIEHLDPHLNRVFMENQARCLAPDGVCLIGTPNITANRYATYRSKIQHINLMSQKTLRGLMEKYFLNVFIFGMNDEVLHTGYGPMAHYIFGMGVGLKRESKA